VLHNPVRGTPAVAVAFGELMVDAQGTRYAFPGVTLSYHRGGVYAATSGKALYYKDEAGGPAIVVAAKGGSQTLYAGFSHPVRELAAHPIEVKAGQLIAYAGPKDLLFEYAPSKGVLHAGNQVNPCGSTTSNGATGTIGLLFAQSSPMGWARFHTLSLDGVAFSPGPYPSGDPDVPTPENLSVGSVIGTHVVAPTVYQGDDIWSSYYVVLCGNVVFASGPNARYAGPFPYPNPTASSSPPLVTPSLPPLVFFRDAGTQGSALTQPLPQPYPYGCPAPDPPDYYTYSTPVFTADGESHFIYYTAKYGESNDTVTFSSSNTAVVTVDPASPSPLPVFATAPPPWPPPSPRGHIVSAGTGAAAIAVYDSSCTCTDAPINVTVLPTPSPAPVPTPAPNI